MELAEARSAQGFSVVWAYHVMDVYPTNHKRLLRNDLSVLLLSDHRNDCEGTRAWWSVGKEASGLYGQASPWGKPPSPIFAGPYKPGELAFDITDVNPCVQGLTKEELLGTLRRQHIRQACKAAANNTARAVLLAVIVIEVGGRTRRGCIDGKRLTDFGACPGAT